jgi:hypothetical protein
MNHYESDTVTRMKDHRALERILRLDARGLYNVVTEQDISMCGFGPAVVMLTAARQLGAKSAELVKYATSGDISGDRNMVVGYAGVVIVCSADVSRSCHPENRHKTRYSLPDSRRSSKYVGNFLPPISAITLRAGLLGEPCLCSIAIGCG